MNKKAVGSRCRSKSAGLIRKVGGEDWMYQTEPNFGTFRKKKEDSGGADDIGVLQRIQVREARSKSKRF